MWLPLAGEKWNESPPATNFLDSLNERFIMLTQTYVQSVFKYENGQLFWVDNRRGAKKNKPIGNKKNTGYDSCMLDGKHYLVHRLIYLYVHGYMPKNDLDHINCNKTDNRIENLRVVTKTGNQQNMKKAFSTSKSQLLGAFYSNKHKNWFSRICVNGKRKWLGCFKTPIEAHEVYIKAKRKFHLTCTI